MVLNNKCAVTHPCDVMSGRCFISIWSGTIKTLTHHKKGGRRGDKQREQVVWGTEKISQFFHEPKAGW